MSLAPHEVDAALLQARRHLASGDGLLTQSICLDVLVVAPAHAEAVVLLVEAIAESAGSLPVGAAAPGSYVALLDDAEERARLEGMLAYRRALSMVEQSVPPFVVRDWLLEARQSFRAAAADRLDVRLRLSAVERLLANIGGTDESMPLDR